MKKILFCLSLSLCTLIPQVASAFEATREGSVLRFTGGIDKESEKAIVQHLRSGASTLIVNSEGGDAGSGQSIAFEIIKQEVHVIVDKYCFSACANYLFLAAKEKSLMPGAVLGFHGGIYYGKDEFKIEKGDSRLDTAMKKAFQKLHKTETALFKKMGINHQIIKDSADLTKVEKRPAVVTIETDGETFTYSAEQSEEIKNLLNKLQKERKIFKANIAYASEQSLNKVYFPSKETLMSKYRVKGISNYPYPSNQDEVDNIAKAIAITFGNEEGFIIVGEFTSEKK
ncbi:MAG: hypothetical protein K2Y28_03070 [Burkholderiaceae bacterium]|nr:hypothetical protein [Burkholderiaceae bacterium]